MKLKKISKPAKSMACVRASVRQAHECLRVIIDDIEGQLSDKIKSWDAKDTKKIYGDYSLYLLMEELLQAVERASNRL